jgi:hypothetical protein
MRSVTQSARVLPGHRVEVVVPELLEGELVDVVVSPRSVRADPPMSIVAFLDSLPEGPRAFASWDEYESDLRDEKGAWDR